MKKARILAVAPYSGLKQLILSIAAQYESLSVDAVEGDLKIGLSLIQQLEHGAYDAILSRGGTASLIARNTDIPVICIGISGYDILRLIKLSQNYREKAVVVGFEAITRGFHSVCELLQADMDIYTVQDEGEIEPLLMRLQQQEDILVIGDASTINVARALGLPNMLVTSGVESVQEAFNETVRYLQNLQKAQEHVALLENMLQQAPFASIFYEQKGDPAAYFGPQYMIEPLRLPLQEAFEQTIKNGTYSAVLKNERGTLHYVQGKAVSRPNRPPAAAYYIQEIAAPASDVICVTNPTDIDKSSFALFATENPKAKEQLERVSLLSDSDIPLLIIGEQGCMKVLLAQMIHCQSPLKDAAFITIDCRAYALGHFRSLLQSNWAPLMQCGNATLLLRHLDSLNAEGQAELTAVLPNLRRVRLLATARRDLTDLVKEGAYSEALCNALAFAPIFVPRLRERPEDIKNLFHNLVAQANTKYGKQIVGIEPEALKLLQEYSWSGNLSQFMEFVFGAAQLEQSPYVTAKVVKSLLSSENEARWNKSRYVGRTLAEIEKEIIFTVLHDTNMNQSQAAKSLGISRTTLYRKLMT